ncbi:hypothetical protein J3E69DRAFT_290360 [Trichoderma sp. SZMC 28015]
MEMLQLKKMELHNMEKLEHPGGAPFQLRVSWIPSYSSRSTKIYGAPSSGIFKGRIQIIGSPECNSVPAKTALRRRCGFPPHGGWRGTFQKEIPRLAGGDVGQRLWERGQDVSCAVFL